MAFLRPGENCRQIDQAERLAFLVDGAAYFDAMRELFRQAEHSIFILCWDIDTRVRMLREPKTDGDPPELGDFLRTLLLRHRGLHIYILAWDFHMIYALERQWWSLLRFRLGANRRLRFHMDDRHPPLASHHQKLIVVDDKLAMVGGLDPTKSRWDTPEHRADDPRRSDGDAGCYPPFHDLEVLVEGPVAAALGRLARERWHRATGKQIELPKPSTNAVWPASIRPDLISVPVAVALTQPAYNGEPEIRDIERLILDAIGGARRYVYFESQYLTSESVSKAIASRLQERDGPEILIIVHPSSTGWLEHHTMDVLRARVLRRMREADRHGRLGVYYAEIPGLGDASMTMHSKVMIVDDEFVRVGSANLSNRSMGFDTECDLALEAQGDDHRRQAIAGLLHRLLGEHLGLDPQTVADRLSTAGSLLKAVEELRGQGRTLETFKDRISAEMDAWVPDASLIDPGRPLETEVLAEEFVPREQRRPARRRIIGSAVFLVALVILAAAWQWTPLRAWLDVPNLAEYLTKLRDSPMGPVLVLGGFVVGGVLAMPVTVLIAATALAFKGWGGFVYSLTGTLVSAAVTYGLGHMLGSGGVRRFAGIRANRLSRRLAQRGIFAVLVIRLIPVAPFTIVNLVAGASHIRLRDFLLGTLLGVLPGIVGLTFFIDRLIYTLRNPGPTGIAVVAVLAAVMLSAAFVLRRWLEKRTGS